MLLTKDISLKFPVGLPDGATLTALTMRRPKAVDVLASNAADESERAVTLLAALCMVSPETFGELDAADFKAANNAFAEMTQMTPAEDYIPGTPIALSTPITIGDTSVSSLSMRRAKVKDITAARKAGISDAVQDCALFATLTGVSASDIQNLDWADYRKIKSIYGDFLE